MASEIPEKGSVVYLFTPGVSGGSVTGGGHGYDALTPILTPIRTPTGFYEIMVKYARAPSSESGRMSEATWSSIDVNPALLGMEEDMATRLIEEWKKAGIAVFHTGAGEEIDSGKDPKRPDTEYIAQGGFGCVLRGGQKCPVDGGVEQTISTPGGVSKLFINRNAFNAEYALQKVVRGVDPERKFTVQMFGACVQTEAELGDDLKRCTWDERKRDLLPNNDQWPKLYIKLDYEDGGQDLDYSPAHFTAIWDAAGSIFKGLVALLNYTEGPVFHNDIKPGNILYHKDTKRLLLVDWGVSTTGRRNGSGSYQYMSPQFIRKLVMPDKSVWIHEDRKAFFVEQARLTHDGVVNLRKEILGLAGLDLSEAVRCGIYRDTHEDAAYFAKTFSGDDLYIANNFAFVNPQHDKRSDTFAWGITLLELLLRPTTGLQVSGDGKKKWAAVVLLLLRMVRVDPDQRISAEKALAEYEKIQEVFNPKPAVLEPYTSRRCARCRKVRRSMARQVN